MGQSNGGAKATSDSENKSGEPKSSYATRLCFVLCRSDAPGDLSQASKVVAEVFGPGYTASVGEQNAVTVMRGEEAIGFLMPVPVPVPRHEAEECADRNFLWPNGRAEAAKHRSHVIVTNMGTRDQTPVESAIAVSRLALVALKLFDGIGVYWGNANVSNSRGIFEKFCANITADHLPVPVWLRFQLVRDANNEGVRLYTLGMRQFGLMEIEVDRCRMAASELFEFVCNIAHYLIQSGPVIKDGNTVGGSAEERVRVLHRPSMIDQGRRVYKIDFDE